MEDSDVGDTTMDDVLFLVHLLHAAAPVGDLPLRRKERKKSKSIQRLRGK